MKCIFKKLTSYAKVPYYHTHGASGIDLHAAVSVSVPPGRTMVIATGLAVGIPRGYEGQVRPRSGLARNGIVAQLGTIDSDYRGEVGVILHNNSSDHFKVHIGDRIAQLVICKVSRAEIVEGEPSPTERGNRGFGSTGV